MQHELSSTRFKKLDAVRLGAGGGVFELGQEVELRGVLDSISSRFYSGGWGFGVLYTDRGLIKITGTLEGHVKGTSLVVRGVFKDSNYGQQLECSSIVVDQVSGELTVIRSWARKHVKDLESEVVNYARPVPVDARWVALCNRDKLEAFGFDVEQAREIATKAKTYLILIETKKDLMNLGFTDAEAEKLLTAYKTKALMVLSEDPYAAVIERVLPFTRIDTVVDGKFARNDTRRLHAAQVQSLVSGHRDGHMAKAPEAVVKEAAQLAGLYPDAVRMCGVPSEIKEYEGLWQLRSAYYSEADIAAWVTTAMAIENRPPEDP